MATRYYTTDASLGSVADAIRSKTGGSDSLVYPDGFVEAIGTIGAISGQAATAAQIQSGYSAWVNGEIQGTMAVQRIYSGEGAPDNSLGSDGDVYLEM